MLSLTEQAGGKILNVKISGKLSKEDYQEFVPRVEKLIKDHGRIRMLVAMHDFHGWEMGALWEDIKFDVKHFGDIERLALVGDSRHGEVLQAVHQSQNRVLRRNKSRKRSRVDRGRPGHRLDRITAVRYSFPFRR
jgi:hypothetical protein